MKKREFQHALEMIVPETPPVFASAVRDTLAGLARCAEKEENAPMKPIVNKRRTLTLILAAILLLAAVATAATLLSRNVFDVTMGDTPQNAPALTQYDLAKETVGNAEITIKEAAYDGMALYVVYGIRDVTATEPMGAAEEGSGERRLTQEDFERIEKLDVGWWWDNLWIDGKMVNMPNMSGGDNLPGVEPGEALYYMQYRLDQENVFLDGKNVEIAMPIGQRQEYDSLVIDPNTGAIVKPEKGMVTFHLDCSSRERVTTETPGILMEGPKWSAKVSQVVYSPIQMYVTVDWEIKPGVLEKYIAENGDGYYQDGVRLWSYDGLEVCGGEIMSLRLVDESGNPVFETMEGFYGCGGASATQVWYTFPYTEEYPEKMYLAPEIDGEIDLTQKIQVK